MTWVGPKPLDDRPFNLNCPGEGKKHAEQEATCPQRQSPERRGHQPRRAGAPADGRGRASCCWGLRGQRGPAPPAKWAGGLRNREAVPVCCLEPPGLRVFAEQPAIRTRGYGERPRPRRVLTAPRGQYSTTPVNNGHEAPLPSGRHRKAPRIPIQEAPSRPPSLGRRKAGAMIPRRRGDTGRP